MSKKRELDLLLMGAPREDDPDAHAIALEYARAISSIEGCVAVVSDLGRGTSRIIAGAMARLMGIGDYLHEDSIWEERILSLMSSVEREGKYIAELRFFNYLRQLPRHKRPDYHLVSKLRFTFPDGKSHDIIHRMYYIYGNDGENVNYAICLYGPSTFDIPFKSCVVNSLTGDIEELSDGVNNDILSRRERQTLMLINLGLTSHEIAERLCISIHTVNRHRHEILSKLQVKNSHEACRIAKTMKLLQ